MDLVIQTLVERPGSDNDSSSVLAPRAIQAAWRSSVRSNRIRSSLWVVSSHCSVIETQLSVLAPLLGSVTGITELTVIFSTYIDSAGSYPSKETELLAIKTFSILITSYNIFRKASLTISVRSGTAELGCSSSARSSIGSLFD